MDANGRKDAAALAVPTGAGQPGTDKKGWTEEVDAHSRQRTAPLARKSLAGPYRPGASARVGALRHRGEPGYGWNYGEAHLGGNAHAHRDKGGAGRRPQGARVRRYAVGPRSLRWRHALDAVADHR